MAQMICILFSQLFIWNNQPLMHAYRAYMEYGQAHNRLRPNTREYLNFPNAFRFVSGYLLLVTHFMYSKQIVQAFRSNDPYSIGSMAYQNLLRYCIAPTALMTKKKNEAKYRKKYYITISPERILETIIYNGNILIIV